MGGLSGVAFQQENDLWQQVQTETDPFEQRRRLIEMAKLLLQQAAESPFDLATVSEDSVMEFLLDQRDAAQYLESLLQQTRPHIDPEYAETPFEAKLQALQQRLAEVATESERIQTQVTTLSSTRQTLETQQEQLTAEQAALDHLNQHVGQLQHNIQRLQQQIDQLQPMLAESETLYQNAVQNALAAMTAITTALRAVYEIHQTHFAENQLVIEGLQSVALTELQQNMPEIEQLVAQIQSGLQQFDRCLYKLYST